MASGTRAVIYGSLTMAEWVIQRLTSVHDRAAFSCVGRKLSWFDEWPTDWIY
jgi:hypothetical protein